MDMAKYIMQILKSRIVIVCSWGFNSPVKIENGLQFRVDGFKFKGEVRIVYNEGSDLFDLSFIQAGKVVNTIKGVFFDTLVTVIDEFVEKTADYEQRVRAKYALV